MDDQKSNLKDPYNIDLDTLDRIAANASIRATTELSNLNLPNAIHMPNQVPLLGARISKNYIRQTTAIKEVYADQAPYLYAYAVKRYWHAAWAGAYWMDEARIAHTVGDTEYTRKMSTVEGYIEIEGGAWTLFNKLAEIDSTIGEVLLREVQLTPHPDDQAVLTAIACYWLSLANQAIESKDTLKALDLIDEAYEALRLENGIHMWNDADRDARKEAVNSKETEALVRSNIGKAAAAARLLKDPKQKAKEWVFGCWNTWQNRPNLYPSQAAFARSMLEKELGLTSQPTIETWCREWKKQNTTLTKPVQ